MMSEAPYHEPARSREHPFRLQNLIVSWRGADRGQSVVDLHNECTAAVGPDERHLVPVALIYVSHLDQDTLSATLRRHPRFRHEPVQFRITHSGGFDAALVPVCTTPEARDRWVLALDDGLSLHDQVALYGHAVGHLLHNWERQKMGQPPDLDSFDGYVHVDNLGELRLVEDMRRTPSDRSVLETYPLLTALIQGRENHAPADTSTAIDLRQQLAAWGWRGQYVQLSHVFTPGRIFLVGSRQQRGQRLSVDALLRAEPSLPIALVHTQRAGEALDDARRRIIDYARQKFVVPFAYLVNNDGTVYEYDLLVTPEPAETLRSDIPNRADLVGRWLIAMGLHDEQARQVLRYPYNLRDGKPPRYYQEAAINQAALAVLQARRDLRRPRILLTLATGTGKTRVAFQLTWKLKRAREISRVLFLTDRDYLIGQAMENEFGPFGQARHRIRGEISTSRDVLFATYQALADTSEQEGLFRDYQANFFDLIIIDECHRGSAQDDSNWRSILEHFSEAVQVGLTATPLRDDNVQTYAYFGNPLVSYSLREGINDGFLAPYRVRRVLLGQEDTSTDETDTPPGASSVVETPAPLLKENTGVIAAHLAEYMRRTGPMAKTIVFCVDQQHAEDMREMLRQECADLVEQYPDYVERVVTEEGPQGRRALSRFSLPRERTPVIVTTSKLLSTGIDVPTCQNIVLVRPIGSMVEFKQIIGRGTRLHEPDKTWFTILDYSGATRLFFDAAFDGDPEQVEIESLVVSPPGEEPAPADEIDTPVTADTPGEGDAQDDASEPPAVSPPDETTEGNQPPASPAADQPPSDQSGPAVPEAASPVEMTVEMTEEDTPATPIQGEPPASEPDRPADPTVAPEAASRPEAPATPPQPATEISSPDPAAGPGDAPAQPGHPPEHVPPMPPVPPPPPDEPVTTITRPRDGTTLQVVGEIFYELGPDGSTLRALSYNDYTKAALSDLIANPGELRAHWLRAEQRAEIERRLQDEGVDMELLARLVHLPDADPFDLLLHVAFGEQALTRRERADRVRRERADFFAQYATAAREILEIILQKYEAGEAPDVSDTDLLRVPPLSERGTFMELAQHFSGGASMRAALRELHTLLYSA